ncbi:siderophore-interacting protein [Parahaliea aestuarii]|uniref:Siderophore-interacting protein n=1 Tax=Parahaliea aestuarii TaxID=1852021 RepID=A0A5C8ZQW6_9GAMM|nr:siderophore-interacting protein [Parahaliea aestuarii]TXS90129.1 siderophore-interacting protein [Parahaliea aestuarii]
MNRPQPRELEVIRCAYITPHMLRVTLGGGELESFPAGQESAYVKLLFPRNDLQKPLMRTYTVSRQRKDEIDIDFALHDNPGPASCWAAQARPGDSILVGGPGPKKLVNRDADWFLLAGDMTALPALSVNLDLLPENARGYLVVEVPDEGDIQNLPHPRGIEVHWVVNKGDAEVLALANKVKALPWLPGQAAVWAACEFSGMRSLRQYFRQQRTVPSSHLYISSYWKQGRSEDEHKTLKRQDAESDRVATGGGEALAAQAG